MVGWLISDAKQRTDGLAACLVSWTAGWLAGELVGWLLVRVSGEPPGWCGELACLTQRGCLNGSQIATITAVSWPEKIWRFNQDMRTPWKL